MISWLYCFCFYGEAAFVTEKNHLALGQGAKERRDQGPTISFDCCPQGSKDLLLGPTS